MKKAYGKPQVRKVKLVPSEAVLQVCKAANTGGPTVSNCQFVGAGPCSAIGS